MADIILNQKLNQGEITPIRGLVSSGIRKTKTACIDPTNNYEFHAGSFVTYETNSKLKGFAVKKVGDNSVSKATGVVIKSSKTDSFSNALGNTTLTVALLGSGIKIYLEAMSAFEELDELEIDIDKGIHKVKKKSTGTKIGIALEEAKTKGDIVLVQI